MSKETLIKVLGSDRNERTLSVDADGNLPISLSTTIAGEDIANDVLKTEVRASYLNGTTSQQVKGSAGRFFGVIVNSHTNGTLKFWDALTATAPILLNTITFASGPQIWVFPVAVEFNTGLFVTIGGTIDYTILYK